MKEHNIEKKQDSFKLVIKVWILKFPWNSPLKFAFTSIVSQMINQLVISEIRDLQYCEKDSETFHQRLHLTPENHPNLCSNE